MAEVVEGASVEVPAVGATRHAGRVLVAGGGEARGDHPAREGLPEGRAREHGAEEALAGLVLGGGGEVEEASGVGMEEPADEEPQLGQLVWVLQVRAYLARKCRH